MAPRPDRQTIEERLDLVADGWLGPNDARPCLRTAFGPKGSDALRALAYASLRAVAWRVVRQVEPGTDAPGWEKAIGLAARLCVEEGRTEEAARLHTLAELVGQSVLFHSAHPPEGFEGKATVRRVAGTLGDGLGSMGLADLAAATGLPDTICARVASAMSSAGYLVLEGNGRDRSVTLTERGIGLAASVQMDR